MKYDNMKYTNIKNNNQFFIENNIKNSIKINPSLIS
jgi:hypothetical protein